MMEEKIPPWRVLHSRQHRIGIHTICEEDIEEPRTGKRLTWTYLLGRNAVGTLALDEANNVVLVREYRHPLQEYIIDLPAGAAHKASNEEELLQAAAREFAEETGLQALHWQKLGCYHPLPGSSSLTYHLYLARGLKPLEQKGEGPEWNEIEEVLRIPFEKVYHQILEGTLKDGPLIIAVLLAKAKGLV